MGFWKQVIKPRIQVSVLAGGHVLTDNVEGKESVNRMTIMKRRQPGEVKVTTAFGQKHFKLSRIEWEHGESRNVGKPKSSTILSTALVGSVGVITDVAFRAMKKETSNAYIYLIDEEGEEHKILIQCTKEQFTQISRIVY
ncbi:hypothetical protein ABIE66_002635 [Peribacillus sp. B2I2]|uniref:hypothetical protein n=2 Tax=unclassified Peribacillus TaxID=2675266 RepID=UPI0025A00B12|nr:hypothetical protein [Peribacillus sp. ACCC06369]MDM5358802.1 hypothetical protein [Peribacillus sp. ACCC06369]